MCPWVFRAVLPLGSELLMIIFFFVRPGFGDTFVVHGNPPFKQMLIFSLALHLRSLIWDTASSGMTVILFQWTRAAAYGWKF